MLLRISYFTTAAAILSTIILIILTHIPDDMLPMMHDIPFDDKQMHFWAFFIVTFLYGISFFAPGLKGIVRLLVLSIIMAIFAAIDEYTQQYFGRTACILDYYADIKGILTAISICLIYWAVRTLVPFNIVIKVSK